MSKKLGLALGSGGACGIAHIGFLQALEDNGIGFDLIAGSSMGGLVGGVYAAGRSLSEIEQEAYKLSLLGIVDLDPALFKSCGLIRGRKVEQILRKLVGDALIEDSRFPFRCTAVDMATSEVIGLDHGDLVTALLATSAIAGVFRPVEWEGRMLVDGGTIERVPCNLAREMGADVVIGVDVLGPIRPAEKPKNMIEFLTRTFNIMDWQITKNKLNEADLRIEIVQEDIDQIQPKNLDKGVEYGYRAAVANLDKIRALIKD